jgi:hypothetical protein
MALTKDFIFIDVSDPSWAPYNFQDFSVSCGTLWNYSTQKWFFGIFGNPALDLPVAKSYKGKDASKGQTLTAKVQVVNSLIKKLVGDGFRVTNFNIDDNDIFKEDGELPEIREALNKRFKEAFGEELEIGWADSISAEILLEIKRIKTENANNGAETIFTKASKYAMLESRSPKTNYDSIFKLKQFCIEAYIAYFGLDHVNGSFDYNFGASLLFNPFNVITTKEGKARITGKAKSSVQGYPDIDLCGKCIIIYRSSSDTTHEDEPLSFGFRADDTFESDQIIKNAIQSGAGRNRSYSGQSYPLLKAYSNNPSGFSAKMLDWVTQAATTPGGWQAGPVVFDDGGMKVRAGIGSGRKDDPQSAGVFNIAFAFRFGENNGSIWIGNMILKFTLNIDNYAAEVGRLQQMRARFKEAVENAQRKIKAAAVVAAAQYTTPPETAAPITVTNLLPAPDPGTSNFATRDQNAATAVTEGTNIFQGTTPPPDGDSTNDGNDTYESNTGSDVLGDW